MDGSTTFRLTAGVNEWCAALQDLLLATTPKRVELVDQDGQLFPGQVRRTQHRLSIQFDKNAQLILYPRLGYALLQAKSQSLWAIGLERWMAQWLDRATFFLRGQRCEDPRLSRQSGWMVERLELASDFTNFRLLNDDAQSFTGGRRSELIRSSPGDVIGEAETIDIGKRGPNSLAVSTHNKSLKLRRVDKVEPDASVYAPTWLAHGWNGAADVRRVEVRAAGDALGLTCEETGVVYDLQDPASLLDPVHLKAMWEHGTTQRTRLVVRTPGSKRALRKVPTDPRWLAVQAAGGLPPQHNFGRLHARQVRSLDLSDDYQKTRAEVSQKLGRLSALHKALRLSDMETDANVWADLLAAPAFERARDDTSLALERYTAPK